MHQDEIKRHIRRADSLKGEAATYRNHVRECAKFCKPRKSDIDADMTPGGKRHQEVYDDYAEYALDVYAAGLQHNTVPAGGKHHNVVVEMPDGSEPDHEALAWAEQTTDVMHRARESSNFQNEVHDAYIEGGYAGIAWLYAEEGDKPGSISYSSRHISEYVVAENALGVVDTVFRVFKMTADQIDEKWPEHGYKAVEDCLTGKDIKPDKPFEVIHMIYPRKRVDQQAVLDPKQKPFASVYAIKQDAHLLEESGYDEFPGGVLRVSKAHDSAYGRSPAMKALADIKMYNRMWRTTIRRGEKETDAPMFVPSEGVIGRFWNDPSRINFYDPNRVSGGGQNAGIFQLPPAGNASMSLELIRAKQEALDRAFSLRAFMLLSTLAEGSADRTQMEIAELKAEKLAELGPLLGRLQSEFFNRLAEREFGILWRAGKIPQPPESLRGARLKVEWIGPIFTAQRKLEKARAIEDTVQYLDRRFAATQDPSVYDNIDEDKTFEAWTELTGCPMEIKRDPRAVQQLRQARQKQQEEMRRLEQVQMAADAANKMGGQQVV